MRVNSLFCQKKKEQVRGEGAMVQVKDVGEIYKCSVCGNVVEVKEAGGGELVCCEKPMELQG